MDKFTYVSSILAEKRALGLLYFECPACGVPHGLRIVPSDYKKTDPNEQVWTWNNDVDKPTFLPSVLVRYHYGRDHKQRICHSWVKEGVIEFLSDCTHSYAGRTVPIPEWETQLD